MSSSRSRLSGLSLVAALLIGAVWLSPATPASAQSESSAILCQGRCDAIAVAPSRGDGSLFDFSLGIEPKGDGLDLSIETDGSVFIVGPIVASGDIRLQAAGHVTIDTAVATDPAGSIVVEGATIDLGTPPPGTTPGAIPPIRGGGVVISHGDLGPIDFVPFVPPVGAPAVLPSRPAPGLVPRVGGRVDVRSRPRHSVSSGSGSQIGGDLTLAAGGSTLFLLDPTAISLGSTVAMKPGSLEIIAALLDGGLDEAMLPDSSRKLIFHHDGDVYLDLSKVELSSLEVISGGAIVAWDVSSMPVPEPSAALLLGLGLGALAALRRIEGASRA